MKATSIEITCSTRKINATWTKEMVDDIKNMKSFDWAGAESKLIEEIIIAEKIEKRNKKIEKLLDE